MDWFGSFTGFPGRGHGKTFTFQPQLELLGNLCLRSLRLELQVPDGVQAQMVNDLPVAGGGWRLPDLA